tara:strand:- start:1827 stop:2060 length:234 start_codon:yes stop_codon:yes gene_type:complete
MTDSAETQKQPILNFEDKKYNISTLSEDAQKLITGMRVADAQIKLQNDNLKVLSVGRQSMGLQLKELLKTATPIDES